MAAGGVVVTKVFTYRGRAEEWANVYHVTGDLSDPDGRRSLATGLATFEQSVLQPDTSYVKATFYDNLDGHHAAIGTVRYGIDVADFSGTVGDLSGHEAPGDAATFCWWKTSRIVRGRPVYLRKFFHNAYTAGATADEVDPTLLTLLNAFASDTTDTDLSGNSNFLCGPAGAEDFIASGAGPYVTTRTLKRRGRRP